MKDSFFTRGPAKLRTMADVSAKLAERTGKIGDRLAVGHDALDVVTRVRVPASEPVDGSSGVESRHASDTHRSVKGEAGIATQSAPTLADEGDKVDSGHRDKIASESNASPAAPLPTQDPALPDAPTGRHAEVLDWLAPVKATQNTVCGRYEIRGARLKDSLLYYAWSMREGIPKLLGYPPTPDAARALCQTHADAS